MDDSTCKKLQWPNDNHIHEHAKSITTIITLLKKLRKFSKNNKIMNKHCIFENRRHAINDKLNKLRKEQDLVQAAMDKDKKISADLNDIVRQREKVTGSSIRALQNAIIQKEKEIEKQLN